ncbi:GH36-type glycosyl hydrolase domain-containing protein [Butyrivibrio sp. MC2013]|uniref:GH36-type glycosyl hydrolase domain-containing protein n=1 Tax=Butyrivibrio sp. MC2013 TaxID=1280686 RepID=UPI00041629E5|nr:hypothetical protein [Butyrivibrio sp. MC2013]
MEYGRFTDNGRSYEISTPLTPGDWTNHLFNDEYYLELSQTLQGEAYIVDDYVRKKVFLKNRFFYLKDQNDNEVWSPCYYPLGSKTDEYRCIHGIHSTELISSYHDISTSIKVFVPAKGSRELWKISISNKGELDKKLSLFSCFMPYDHGVMGGKCEYDPESKAIIKHAPAYHALYEDYEATLSEKTYIYTISDTEPSSFDMSFFRFFGPGVPSSVPAAVTAGRLSGVAGEAEDFCSAFAYDITLMPGESRVICLEAGATSDPGEISSLSRSFSSSEYDRLEEEAVRSWKRQLGGLYINTPDKDLDAFANYWLKKQIIELTTHNRGGTYCPVRNRLQDAMGLAMIDPVRAGNYLLDVIRLQHRDGFLQQWHDTSGGQGGALCRLRHTDGPVWLVICLESWIRRMADEKLFFETVPYADGGKGTLLEHMIMALRYLADHTGERGLCLMGDGDWNDPINGAGRKGRGESVWLSEAFIYAVRRLMSIMERYDPMAAKELRAAAGKMRESVNEHAWCTDRYAAAIDDDGVLLGDVSDRLFLNSQSWAVIADLADEGRYRQLFEIMGHELMTPFGPLLMNPPFYKWDPRWGRISVKMPGTTENGSVYCHASMFYAYAQALMGDADGLYDTIRRTLPTNPYNPPSVSLQCPTYLANYYYGIRTSPNYGRSSRHYGTGTVAWMLFLIIEEIFGIRDGSADTIDPCLPSEWDRVSCRIKTRDGMRSISIRRDTGKEQGYIITNRAYDGDITATWPEDI